MRDKPSAAWLRFLALDRIEGDTGILRPLPGHREVLGFVTPARLEPVAGELSTLRGVRTRLVLQAPSAEASQQADQPGEAAGGGVNRRAAMQIPLVRQALEVFPDAMLIDVRPEESTPEPENPDAAPDEDEA